MTDGSRGRSVRGGRKHRWLGSSVLAAVVLACTAVSTRPHLGPLPGAVVDTLRGGPASVIDALAAEVTAGGLTVRAASRAEGYLETAWFDPQTRASVGREHAHIGRVFRLRAYADSIPPIRSQLVLEAVYRRTADPSAVGREEEIVAPPGHPGDSLAQHVLENLRKRFP